MAVPSFTARNTDPDEANETQLLIVAIQLAVGLSGAVHMWST